MDLMSMNASSDLSRILPRVLIVSRRTVRKNKFVDFVGEYHLDLIVKYGAVPIIVPRVTGIHTVLSSFEPIHGVLLCEGEDIHPSHYSSSTTEAPLTPAELDEIRAVHSSDTTIDTEKDSIELGLAKLCLERNIPYLGICRGSQVLNVACGGTLYQDVDKELNKQGRQRVVHMDYENYDGHRHVVNVERGTPLEDWFKDSLMNDVAGGESKSIMVNSYHHQGVKKLASKFVPMAYAPDGLIEGFYDRDGYNPDEGKFTIGIQFHPERMRKENSNEFDYSGCPTVYKEFVKAVTAYEKKLRITTHEHVTRGISTTNKLKLEIGEMEKKRKRRLIVRRSFSIANEMHIAASGQPSADDDDFLQKNTYTTLSLQQEERLKQMGATVRNGFAYRKTMKMISEEEIREHVTKSIIGKMSTEQLSDMISFYYTMGQICSEVLETKIKLLQTSNAL